MYIVFNQPIKLNNSDGTIIYRHGDSIGVGASWCRELVVNKMSHLLTDLSIKELIDTTATIFGICSHEFNIVYQRNGWRKQYTENPELDREMLRWFQYTIQLCIGAGLNHTPEYNQTLLALIKPLSEKVGMWQNDPPEGVQSLVDEIGPEKTNGRGGFYGVPAALLKSPPILSLLLYLPRLCESLNRNRARLWKLRDLTGVATYRYSFPRAFERIFKQFPLPISFTDFGGAEFWTMYYLLSRVPPQPNWLFHPKIENQSGFRSGIVTLYGLKSFPEEVKNFYQDYKRNGFHTLVKTKRISY